MYFMYLMLLCGVSKTKFRKKKVFLVLLCSVFKTNVENKNKENSVFFVLLCGWLAL